MTRGPPMRTNLSGCFSSCSPPSAQHRWSSQDGCLVICHTQLATLCSWEVQKRGGWVECLVFGCNHNSRLPACELPDPLRHTFATSSHLWKRLQFERKSKHTHTKEKLTNFSLVKQMITGIPLHTSPHICHICGKHFQWRRNIKTHTWRTQLGGNHNIGGRMSGWEGGKSSGVSIGAEQTPQLPGNWVIKSRRKYFFPHYLIWWLSDVEGGVSATIALLNSHYFGDLICFSCSTVSSITYAGLVRINLSSSAGKDWF